MKPYRGGWGKKARILFSSQRHDHFTEAGCEAYVFFDGFLQVPASEYSSAASAAALQVLLRMVMCAWHPDQRLLLKHPNRLCLSQQRGIRKNILLVEHFYLRAFLNLKLANEFFCAALVGSKFFWKHDMDMFDSAISTSLIISPEVSCHKNPCYVLLCG